MKFKALVLCLTTVLALAATADAQPGGGNRRGPGGGPMGGGGSIFSIANNEAVQKEIGLSDEGVAKVKTIRESFREAIGQGQGGGGGGNFRDMSDEERRAAMEKFQANMKSATETYLPKLKEALTPDQFTRVQQIYWQSLRLMALSDAEVIKAVSITQAQQDKIKAVGTEFEGKRRELFASFQNGGGDREANREKMIQIGKDQEAKTMEILTKEQQDKFASIKGKEFDLNQLGGGGPGGPGGGGRQKRPQPKAE